MTNEKTFSVVGVSTRNGTAKVRFSNDFANRMKMLTKTGHTDIDMVDMKVARTKIDAVRVLFMSDSVTTLTKHVAQGFLVANGAMQAVGRKRDALGRFVS